MTQQKNWRIARVLLGTLLPLATLYQTGCSLTRETHKVVELARRTTFVEPRFYDYVRSDKIAQREARLRAEQAWAEVAASVPNATPDYENGFTEGFADYLFRGGEGEPPLIPPRGYWNLRFLNRMGKTSTEDWYAGFRHGAQTCKASGLRDDWTVPTSLFAKNPVASPTNAAWQRQSISNQLPASERNSSPPPIPNSRPINDEASQQESEISDADGSASPETLATESESNEGRLPSDASETSSESTSKEEKAETPADTKVTEPFGDILLESTPSVPAEVPDADAEGPAPTEDDIFSLPDGAFESSESFEPDVDDLDFNFQSSRPAKKPMLIKSVEPILEMAPRVVLTSGEWSEEDETPPAPNEIAAEGLVELPLLPTPVKKRVAADDVSESTKERSTVNDLPRGRPRMRHYRPGPNIKSSIPNRAKVKAVLKELPLSKVRSRIDIDQEPSETEIAAFRDDKNEGPSERSSANIVDDALLLDLPPLQLTQAPERRPQVPVAAEMSGNEKNKVPVIVWMDDEQPIEEKVAALPSKIRIDQDAWDPFSGDVKPAEALEFATVTKRPNGEKSSERATAWNPQRDRELPLRLGEPMDATRTPSRKQTLAGQAGLESSDVRMRAASQTTPIPRIYLQQASNTQQ